MVTVRVEKKIISKFWCGRRIFMEKILENNKSKDKDKEKKNVSFANVNVNDN